MQDTRWTSNAEPLSGDSRYRGARRARAGPREVTCADCRLMPPMEPSSSRTIRSHCGVAADPPMVPCRDQPGSEPKGNVPTAGHLTEDASEDPATTRRSRQERSVRRASTAQPSAVSERSCVRSPEPRAARVVLERAFGWETRPPLRKRCEGRWPLERRRRRLGGEAGLGRDGAAEFTRQPRAVRGRRSLTVRGDALGFGRGEAGFDVRIGVGLGSGVR